MIKPLFKYTGGKYSEWKKFGAYIPDNVNNYYEPFAGSCGVYLRMRGYDRIQGMSYINDSSEDLINFLKHVGNEGLYNELVNMNEAWKGLGPISSSVCSEYGEEFMRCIVRKEGKFCIDDLLSRVEELVKGSVVIGSINWGGNDIVSVIKDSVKDKVLRFSRKELDSDDLGIVDVCLSTGIYQGFYFGIRRLYNEWLTDIDCKKYSDIERAMHWFFIREMCYCSMFRFNGDGKFNVPYGGYSYNGKVFDEKIRCFMDKETVEAFKRNVCLSSVDFEEIIKGEKGEDDFIFLDPPYDSTFTDYDNNAFGHNEHERLANVLKGVKCKWMLVIKNTEFIYNLYNGWSNILSFDKTYMYQVRGREYDRNVEHLIITNYLC